jgi:hypothetical protein
MSTHEKNTIPQSCDGENGTAVQTVRDVIFGNRELNAEDFQKLAEDFDIPVEDAEQVVLLLTDCFDQDGRFKRDIFEKYLTEFSRHKKIFEILWNCLKNTIHQDDRMAFLNAIQLLIVMLQQPKNVLRTLLNDFNKTPEVISDADRDSLMLSNLLVRKYNKELHTDIEATPEEVLLVKNGLDTEVTKYAQWRIESVWEQFQQKIQSIGRRIAAAMDADNLASDGLSIQFLLSLDRELFIFLSLVGGDAAYRVIRASAEYFGNPESRIYQSGNSMKCLPYLLEQLKILVRGLGRVGGKQDLMFLRKIKQREEAFMQFSEDPDYQGLVRQVLQWVDTSMDRAVSNPAG